MGGQGGTAACRQQSEGMAPLCRDPQGWARSCWLQLALADTHHWQQPPELVMLRGNPRGFGFAGNEMRRGQGAPLAGGSGFPAWG